MGNRIIFGSADPAVRGEAITPSDSVYLTTEARSLYVGTGGNASIVFADGSVALLKNLVGGMVYPFQVKRVNATGTTAADMVALS